MTFHDDGWLQNGDGGALLAMVNPHSRGDLVRVGENTFRSLGPVTPVPDHERQIRAGWLEQSGVEPTQAMIEMIETSRAFEANVKMIQSHDQMTGSLINRILKSQ